MLILFLLWKNFFDFDLNINGVKLTGLEGIVNNLLRIKRKDQELLTQRRNDAETQSKPFWVSLRLSVFALKLLFKWKGGSMNENEISQFVIQSAIEVHRTLGGPCLLEIIYENALEWELQKRGLAVKTQCEIPVFYKGILLPVPLRVDLIIESLVIVECKATMENHPVFESQLLTYLRVTGLHLGLLVNFGFPLVSRGISRVVNNLEENDAAIKTKLRGDR